MNTIILYYYVATVPMDADNGTNKYIDCWNWNLFIFKI